MEVLRLALAASLSWLTAPGWLQQANDALYLIGFAVLQCMDYQRASEVRQKTFYFNIFKVLLVLARLT